MAVEERLLHVFEKGFWILLDKNICAILVV